MIGFHRNAEHDLGLLPSTRALLSKPRVPYDLMERDSDKIQSGLGATKFLKLHTSTTQWEDFQTLFKQAQELDFYIFAPTLWATVCTAVRDGWFEKKSELGCRQMYRRVEGEWRPEKKKPGVKTGFPKRKFTAKNW